MLFRSCGRAASYFFLITEKYPRIKYKSCRVRKDQTMVEINVFKDLSMKKEMYKPGENPSTPSAPHYTKKKEMYNTVIARLTTTLKNLARCQREA